MYIFWIKLLYYQLLYNTLPQNSSLKQDSALLSHTLFWGQESGVAYLGGSGLRSLLRLQSLEGLTGAGGSSFKSLTHIAGKFVLAFGRSLSSLPYETSSQGCLSILMTLQLAFQRQGSKKEEATMSFMTQLRHSHLSNIVLIIQVSPIQLWDDIIQGFEHQEAEISGSHFGNWLPQFP